MQERDKNWEPESHTINDGRGGGGSDEGTYKIRCPGKGGHLS